MNEDGKCDLCYEALQAQRDKLREENSRLKACLKNWQDGEFNKPKHILSFDDSLSTEQYERLKRQCEDNFGSGKFILLEGGLQYKGMTTIQPD